MKTKGLTAGALAVLLAGLASATITDHDRDRRPNAPGRAARAHLLLPLEPAAPQDGPPPVGPGRRDPVEPPNTLPHRRHPAKLIRNWSVVLASLAASHCSSAASASSR